MSIQISAKMVSYRSVKPIIWAINFGYFIGAIPVAWDPINFCMVLKLGQSYRVPFCPSRTLRIRSGYISGGIYALFQLLNTVYVIFFLLYLKRSNIDLYIGSCLLGGLLFATALQLLVIFSLDDFVNMVNVFLLLDLKIRK